MGDDVTRSRSTGLVPRPLSRNYLCNDEGGLSARERDLWVTFDDVLDSGHGQLAAVAR